MTGGEALAVALTLSLVAFLAWGTYRTGVLLRTVTLPQNLLLLPAENGLRLFLLLLCLLLAWLSGREPARFGWPEAGWPQSLWLGLVLGLVGQWLTWQATTWAVQRWGPGIYNPVIIRGILPRCQREWVLVPLAMLPAVLLEEVIFRAFLVGWFSLWLPVEWLVVVASLLFGLMHSPQGRLGVIGAALLSLGLSALFLWRGDLVAPVVAHFTLNFLQMMAYSRAYPDIEKISPNGECMKGNA